MLHNINAPVIAMQQVGKTYPLADGMYQALHHVDLTIEQNEYVAIVGPSGSGKSTLLNLLGCLDSPSHGHYRIRDERVDQLDAQALAGVRNRHIGFIFQSFQLLPRLTVLQNVLQPLVYRLMPQREREARAMHLLSRVGLADKAHHLPNQLSGGQRQRVAIARALVKRPPLVIADEPTANLDGETAEQIIELMQQLGRDANTTFLIASHDPRLYQRCDRVLTLKDGCLSQFQPQLRSAS